MHTITLAPETLNTVTLDKIQVGQFAIVISSTNRLCKLQMGDLLVCSYRGLVLLSSPRDTWSLNEGCPEGVKVRILEPGESFTVTVGAGR